MTQAPLQEKSTTPISHRLEEVIKKISYTDEDKANFEKMGQEAVDSLNKAVNED